ncbi:glycosyl hydrolase, partial [Elsinoe ampelina]
GVFSNFADPYILQHEGVWYAYATNNAIGAAYAPKNGAEWRFDLNNVQMAVSTDFYNWNLTAHTSEPLPNVGAWSDTTRRKHNPKLPQAGVWAPMVFQRPSDKKWIMYYSARPSDNENMHCIGAAVSTGLSPAGPFIPEANAFTCPQSLGGAIDPTPYIETEADGTSTIYVIYKIDGNNRGHGGQCGNTVPPLQKTPIMLQKTKSDGVTPEGDPVELLDRDSADHDGPLVEAPALVKSDEGTYFLFFSSGCTANDNYNVKYATSSSVSGPYVRAKKPLLHTRMYDLLSPGSCSLAKGDDGKWRIAFHARVYTIYGGLRSMFTSGVRMNGTKATLFNPDQ